MTDQPEADLEQHLLGSWHDNARAWTQVVRHGRIASRRLATDAAIVDAIGALGPQKVVDIGCGEGWLMRVLADNGIQVVGFDAVPALVAGARSLVPDGLVYCVDYQQAPGSPVEAHIASADVAVCNFSLLGDSSTTTVLAWLAATLKHDAWVLIQTLHPSVQGEQAASGWRQETWSAFDGDFVPAPWYYRPMAGWQQLLQSVGFRLVETTEIFLPQPDEASVMGATTEVGHPPAASIIIKARR